MTSSTHVPPAGWYSDPTGRHTQRYWDGTRWTEHVATGASTVTDPIDPSAAGIPPAPGTEARAAAPPTQRVEVTTRSGGSVLGAVIGVLIAAIVLVVVLIVLSSNDSTEPATTEPVSTLPVPTRPDTTEPVETEPLTTELTETEPPATGAP